MEGKRVLVTGSSRGIGKAISLRLAQDGWQVAIHYTSGRSQAEETVSELGLASAGLYQADLSVPSNASGLFETALADGPIHAVVNNAGVYAPIDFSASDDASFDENWAKTFAINLESPARMMRVAGKYFAEQGGGKILNVASRVGFRGEPGAAIYAASKAGLINLTRSLAVEWAPKKIGVFGIAPGWVDTAMVRDGMEDRLESILSTLPLGRMASPGDCAATSAFLLSEEASYLSGVTIDINGASYFH
jgi:3-oxoacyl-[acyl-carrier protein] reductase